MCRMSVSLEINSCNRSKAFEAALAVASALIKMGTRNVSALSRLTCLYTVQIGKNIAVSQTRLCANCFFKLSQKTNIFSSFMSESPQGLVNNEYFLVEARLRKSEDMG